VFAPEIGHHGRHAVDGAFGFVHARQRKLRHRADGVGKHLVRMANQDRVDARHFRQMPVGVFHVGRVGAVVQAAVRNRHHHVSPFGTHLRHVLLRRLHDALRTDFAVEPTLVPRQNRGRCEANDAHPQAHFDRAAVGLFGIEGFADDLIRGKQRLTAFHAYDVGQHLRKFRPGTSCCCSDAVDLELAASYLVQVRQTVVELMVPDACTVVADVVHHLVHGQHLIAGNRVDLRLVVRQSGALNRVTVVEQQVVRRFRARRFDERGHPLKAERLVFGQLEIVVALHVGVQVGGFQQRQRSARTFRDHRCVVAAAARSWQKGGRAERAEQDRTLQFQSINLVV